MSKEVALEKLKRKFPTMKLLHHELFEQPESPRLSGFVPFVSERDDLGRIITDRSHPLLKTQPLFPAKTTRPFINEKVRRKDEVGLDNLLDCDFSKPMDDFNFGGKLTKHEFVNDFNSHRSRNKIGLEPRLKLVKTSTLPQVLPFYELEKHDDFFYRRTPITRITPPRPVKDPQQEQKPAAASNCIMAHPVKKVTRQVIRMPKCAKQSRQGARGLQITENLAEEFKKFQVELDKARNLALRVKNETIGLKSYVR